MSEDIKGSNKEDENALRKQIFFFKVICAEREESVFQEEDILFIVSES